MSKKPSDLTTRLAAVKDNVRRDPVLTSCQEVLRAYEFFRDADVEDEHLLALTSIAIDNLWEEP